MFNPRRCYLNIWCGNPPKPAVYRRIGTPYECLRKGYGIGKHSTHQNPRSLDALPYMTDARKTILRRLQITNLFTLLTHVNNFPSYRETRQFLENDLSLINGEHFNKMVLFLYEKGIPNTKLPKCKP